MVRLSAGTPAAFTPRKYSWYSFLLEVEWPQGHSADRRIMPNSNDIIDNWTRDLLSCSAVPQPTAPLRCSPPDVLPTGNNSGTLWTEGFVVPSVGLAFSRGEKFLVYTGIRTLDSHWAVRVFMVQAHSKNTSLLSSTDLQIYSSLFSVLAFFHFSPILPLFATVLPYFLDFSFLSAQADSNSNISEFYFCCVRFDCRQKHKIFWDFWIFLGPFKPIPISNASYYTISISSNPNLLTAPHLQNVNYWPSLN